MTEWWVMCEVQSEPRVYARCAHQHNAQKILDSYLGDDAAGNYYLLKVTMHRTAERIPS
jgi:hypothetical protein